MRGFIRRRGDAWELRVFLGVDAVTGRKRYVNKTVRSGRREADRELNRLVAAAEAGRLANTHATVAELLERWFAMARPDFSPKTVLETRGLMDRELLPGLGHVKLSKLRAEDIDAFYARMRATGGGRRGNGLSPGTIKRAHGILRRALQQGVRWGWLGVNPAVGATPPRVLPSELRPPTPAELNRLLDTAERKNPEFATFVTLSATSGARRSELLALRWPDVDLDHATLTTTPGVARRRGHVNAR